MNRFRDRTSAGIALGARLAETENGSSDVIVLGLPRGGVPVAVPVAECLDAPVDVLVVRKLGVPGQEEFAMGAIASGGARMLNIDLIDRLGIADAEVERVVERETAELGRREAVYRAGAPPLDLKGKRVIVVDDGIATGASMGVAVEALRGLDPASIVVAAPVASEESVRDLERIADRVVVSIVPRRFLAVGYWYDDFGQTTDDEVVALLERRL
jgi:predicted phosphoribosyltransferase